MAGRLIVPLDGSSLGEAALPWAAYLARQRGLGIVLVQVIPWPLYLGMDGIGGYISPDIYDQVLAAERETANDYLDGVRRRLAGDGLAVETVIRDGLPADRLLDLADEIGAYAIVMSTHGHGGLTRLLLGSVAERVLQQATVPVLLVRALAEPAAEPVLGRVLVPLDGSALAEMALDLAADLVGDGTLLLTRVVAPVELVVPGAEVVVLPDQPATDRAIDAALEYLRVLVGSRGLGGRKTELRVRVGDAAEQILQATRDEQVDLVIMSTHGRTGPGRWLLGSVADQVARRAERPVFLVSARSAAARVVGRFAVADVMTRDLETLAEEEPLITALRKLLRRRVSGAPVVDKAGELVGVLSEYDLLRWQAGLVDELSRGADLDPKEYAERLEHELVRSVMSSPAVSIDESASLGEALRLLVDRRLRRLPVTRDGRLVGIVARSDLLRAMAAQGKATDEGTAAIDSP